MRLRILALWLMLIAPTWGEVTAESIFARARALNPKLLDYSANIEIRLRARLGFIPYSPNLKGRYLHKRPDKHKLELENAPGYLKKYPNVFGFNLPDLERYNVLRIQYMRLRRLPVYKVMLVPKTQMGDITSLDVYVHRDNFTVPKYDTFYNKGHLFVDIDFKEQEGFWLFDKMSAQFEFPSLTATADAQYQNYEFNKNLADELFLQ